MTPSPRVAVVGGGPAGLMAAEVLSGAGLAVDLYERMPSLGRKFLYHENNGQEFESLLLISPQPFMLEKPTTKPTTAPARTAAR